MIVSYLDNMIPLPIAAPGIKLGLANIVTVTAIYIMGLRSAAIISIIRVVLSGLLFTGINAMMYALAGALLAFTGMAIAYKSGLFSVIGVSVIGALLHNTAQYGVAALIAHTYGLLSYLPILFIAGSVTGIIVGYVAFIVIGRMAVYGKNDG